LECIFKSSSIITDGFEDEMQQQWKALISKYELTNHQQQAAAAALLNNKK
jgi:hypothetical protein